MSCSLRNIVCAAWLAPLLACAAPSPPRLLSPTAVVLPLPVVDQDRLYDCGLVSAAALCRYYRTDVPDDLRDSLLLVAHDHHGLSGGELATALRSLGMEVWVYPGTLDRQPTGLLHHVDAGRPVLVMTGPEDERHYVLFVGYDEALGNVCVLDPLRGQVVLPEQAFDRIWSEARRFSLLAVPAVPTAAAMPAGRERHAAIIAAPDATSVDAPSGPAPLPTGSVP